MKKRLQIILTQEAWDKIEKNTEKVNAGFSSGSISYSDVICELVMNGALDIKAVQLKHADWRRSLRAVASNKEMDIDAAIKSLMELKNSNKTRNRKSLEMEEDNAQNS